MRRSWQSIQYALSSKTSRQNRSTVLERNTKYPRLALSGESEFVSQVSAKRLCGEEPGRIAGNPHQFGGLILDRSDHLLLLRVPPLVSQNAMAAGISAGQKGGMSGRGVSIDVVVVAVGEIRAMVQESLNPPSPNWSR